MKVFLQERLNRASANYFVILSPSAALRINFMEVAVATETESKAESARQSKINPTKSVCVRRVSAVAERGILRLRCAPPAKKPSHWECLFGWVAPRHARRRRRPLRRELSQTPRASHSCRDARKTCFGDGAGKPAPRGSGSPNACRRPPSRGLGHLRGDIPFDGSLSRLALSAETAAARGRFLFQGDIRPRPEAAAGSR